MNIYVDETTIKNTTKCNKEFACLNGDKSHLCEVKVSAGYEAIFVMCPDTEYCCYQIPFAGLYICSCPTRKEIYQRYKY